MDINEQQVLNPWTSMWTKPRATIAQVVATDPKRSVLTIVSLAAIFPVIIMILVSSTVFFAFFPQIHFNLTGVLLAGAIVGAICGILGLYFSGWLLATVCSWFDSRATQTEMRAAIAWSTIPNLWTIPLLLIQIYILASGFVDFGNGDGSHLGSYMGFLTLLNIIKFIIGIWGTVLLCKSVGEVTGFSAWKAFGCILLSFIIFALVIFAISLLFRL
ncbi:YIP1 family protein [Celerinatantimonas sp. MCCC 1A17872]|uniref:YIP1 family protein n=1 Tax=Celerinatantimonas sp. MCCC 1A17872 TaxID=3177514 RepID=UPI0038C18DFC